MSRRGALHAEHPHAHRAADRRRLSIALALALVTATVEVAGGLASGSLALLADAGHVVTDATALSLALGAVWLAARPHNRSLTFGYHRVEVLAASANGLLLFGVSALVAWHALERLRDPREVEGGLLLTVALLGLGANAVALVVLHGSESVNVRAARLHVLADLGGSVVAVGAGTVTTLTGWQRADPILSLVIVVLVCLGAWRLLADTIAILMQRTPPGLDLAAIERALRAVPGIHAVHDVHVWAVTSGFLVFTAHVEVAGPDPLRIVHDAVDVLRDDFGIEHAAIHPEPLRLLTLDSSEAI